MVSVANIAKWFLQGRTYCLPSPYFRRAVRFFVGANVSSLLYLQNICTSMSIDTSSSSESTEVRALSLKIMFRYGETHIPFNHFCIISSWLLCHTSLRYPGWSRVKRYPVLLANFGLQPPLGQTHSVAPY